MRGIAALLSGRDRRTLSDLFKLTDDDPCCGSPPRPGQWCQTPPGHEAISRLGGTLRGTGRMRGRGTRVAPRG